MSRRSLPPRDAKQSFGWLAGPLALLFGAALVLHTFPLSFLLPSSALVLVGDASQHVIAQRYFIGDAWRWPLLHIPALNTPEGSNLAFLDGIPALALALKLLRGWLPPGLQGVTLFYGLTFLAQPVAAVWALRGAGETRLLPLLATAVLAGCAPALWYRFGHAALTGQAVLLLALGLYLRLLSGARPGLWAASAALAGLALLIHPYFMVMVLALLLAVPLTLLLRGAERWRRAVLGALACCASTLILLIGLDYLGAEGGAGFGRYALNLLSPVWPSGSVFFPGLLPVDAADYGGNLAEGYNYLGAGLLLGLLAALLRPRAVAQMVRRHAGLAIVLLALTMLSVSTRVALGPYVLLDLGPPPKLLEQFRASGRFLWPVGYAAMLAAVLLIARGPSRRRGTVLAAVALLQFIDTLPLRQHVAATAANAFRPPAADVSALTPLLPQATTLTLLPSWNCGTPLAEDVAANQALLLDIIGLAALRQLPVSTMYPARWHGPLRCRDREQVAAPLAPGELRVILPGGQSVLTPWVPAAAAHCRWHGGLVVCSPNGPGDLQQVLQPGQSWAFSAGGSGGLLLGTGWAPPESWGVWSAGKRATLRVHRQGALQLTWRIMGFAPPGAAEQRVMVVLDGEVAAEWTLPDQQVVQRSLIIPALPGGGPFELEFLLARPARPIDRGLGVDPRTLGMALITLDTQASETP